MCVVPGIPPEWKSPDEASESLRESGADEPSSESRYSAAEQVSEEAGAAATESRHVDLCPKGGAATRWYLCRRHTQGLIFRAGSGRSDSVANSCPVCGGLSARYSGCTCEYAAFPLDRAERPGRRILRKDPVKERL